jgi:uncharacterized membrane protein
VSAPPRVTTKAIAIAHYAAIVSLTALIVLSLLWETVLAPARPGGSWLMLKALPLLLPLFGILRGKRYTYQWASMLILLYFTEAAVRAWSDKGLSQAVALVAALLSVIFFTAALCYARMMAPSRQIKPPG